MSDWFARWFGEEYLELYPHRDEAEAHKAVALIHRTLGARAVTRVLDLACGTGRHSRALREFAWTVGFDLSMTLLEVARREGVNDPYVRGDMRTLPFAAESFGLVVNLFTSFGYFDTDDEHRWVIREVRRVMRRGGTFVLDYLNATQVRETLVPHDEREIDGQRVRQERSISADDRYVLKTIWVDGRTQPYVERVRLFSRDDLREMLEGCGFSVTCMFGDYDGAPCSEISPRVILFGECR